MDYRPHTNKYLVRWKGYDPSQDYWVDVVELTWTAPEAVQAWQLTQYLVVPRRLRNRRATLQFL